VWRRGKPEIGRSASRPSGNEGRDHPAAAGRSSFVKRRALIVDDEREARRRLARLLAAHSEEIEIAGEAVDGSSAVEAIQKLEPDVVFLDIEMPALDGFGVLDSLP